jgi:hypothetical protein
MKSTLHRGLLALLTFTGFVVGLWAYAAPGHWYDTFPGMGMSWIPQLGPYNEHFIKDVGAFFLALALLSVFALIHITNVTLVRVTAGTWTVFNLLHFVFHMQMLHMYEPRDQVLNGISLFALLVASVALFVPVRHPGQTSIPGSSAAPEQPYVR